ncbi:MAG TPA: xanthine dehydrogenase family protein molybdopterin-binding subunit [Methylomirabilota bacterium]|jgi:aerobic carbon-monoxide dehydrogenase large subunit|nr:xanthine dehydrogenase family protein molybdopterin-binding subunit [Methylomirabilota bacterium]
MSDPVTIQKFAMGQSVSRVEDPRLVQGLGRYSDDVNLPRQAYAVVVRSPHAHARVVAIETAAARQSPGALAVLTGAELAADGVGHLPTDATRKRRDGSPAFTPPRPALARDRVRHVGDPVALVVAASPEAAADAADLVVVDYAPLPAVTGAERATRPGAPAVWDEAPDNVAFVWEAGSRDTVARAFAQAAHVTHLDFVVTRVAAAPLEPRAAVGDFDRRSGRYTLYTGIQGPHGLRAQLAEQILRVPHGQVRVVTDEVGGSFGMRSGMYPELVLVLWAAKRLGRPVKWTSTRREGFVSDEPGRDNVSAAELALDARGRFLALRVALKVDIGAYLTPRSAGPATNNVGGLAGTYTTPAIHIESTGVYTNTTPTGPYRGAGRPEATYAIERVIDVAARELGIDPIELRRRNLIPPSAMPFKTGLVFTYDCGEFERVMTMALTRSDRAGFERRRAEARARGKLLGLGLANPIEVAGGPYTSVNPDTAELRINPDGSVSLFAGTTSMGQGNETAFAQIVSDRLGVPPERIQVFWGDSDALGAGRGNGGSGAISVGGAAVLRATERVVERGRRLAAHLLEAAAEDVTLRDGRFVVAGTDRDVAWSRVARAAYQRTQPAGLEPGFSETATFTPPSVTFPNGCHVCEVEIDPDTGAVRVVRYTVVDDVGRMINPLLVKGQIHGGAVQGLGQGLAEVLAYDEAGQVLAGSFMDYAMPRADDVPSFDVDAHEVPTRVNPLGAKGVGEAGTVGALPALLNAVNDALAPLGVRHLDMPASPERVWQAIRVAGRVV